MGRVRPAVLRVLIRALDAPNGPRAGEHVLVAASGGPDSTALLAGLAELAPQRGLALTAGHVDHGLRGAESAAEGRAVAALAARLGTGFVSRAASVPGGPGLESRARVARYRALAAMATGVAATRIATGHTRDDQVETVLMRLLRGAGRRGLGGIRPVRGRLIRPLLDATRADVRRYLAERELPFAVDRTNADLRLTRNRVRRLLVPFLEADFNPDLARALAMLATRLRDEDDLLAALGRARAADHVAGDDLRATVASEPPALARRIVRAWLEGPRRPAVSAAHVERVLGLAIGTGRGVVAMPGPARVLREGDRLVRRSGCAPCPAAFERTIAPGSSVAHPTAGWTLTLSAPRPRRAGEVRPGTGERALFDADTLPAGVAVRSPAAGDRIRLLGGGTRKLQDILVDAKVPRELRVSVPVLVAGIRILWVPGLARAADAAVERGTSRIVEGVLVRGPAASDCRS